MFRRASALIAVLGATLLLPVLTSCIMLPAGTTLSMTSPSEPPLSSFASSHFVGSGKCATCHGDLVDEKGNVVDGDTIMEPPKHSHVRSIAANWIVSSRIAPWNPDFLLLREPKSLGHHAKYRGLLAVHPNEFTHNVRI